MMNEADLPHVVIGACMNVHRQLGPGLARGAYEECAAIELRELEMDFRRGESLSFHYRGKAVEGAARLDFIVQDKLLLLIRAQEQITALDKLQFESHLRLSGLRMGVMVNFNVTVLRSGIHRATLKRKES
jgi:GxxExxY protein